MTGKVVIITGANTGLGYEVSRYLAEGGNDVILACRSEEKANRAIEKIKRQNPNALATYMNLDLMSLESVRKFVDDFHETGKKLNILVNNAAVQLGPKDTKRQFTKENFEMTMGTNHLGPFLLTNLLLEDLKKAAAEENGEARIINVSTSSHDPEAKRRNKSQRDLQAIDLENFFLFNQGSFNGLQAYKNSKAANIMFTYELARRLEETNVTVNAICPGFIPSTELMRNSSGAQKFFQRYIMHGMLRFTKATRTTQQGATAINNLATDEKWKGVNGKFIKEGNEVNSSEETRDEEKQKKLWEMSGGLVSLEGYETIEVTPPPPEEEKKKEEKKDKKEDGEVATDGEAKPAGEGEEAKPEEGENKTDEDKTEEKKEEETKEEEEKKEEEKKEEVEEEKKEEVAEEEKPAEEAKEETKEEEEKKE